MKETRCVLPLGEADSESDPALVLRDLGVKTLYIEPGSPCKNGYMESFNEKSTDELLNVEIFTTLFEAQVLIEN